MIKLSSSTVKLITSTQVITSIYAIVKELVENALDAGADSIDIRMDQHGIERIEVQDNGFGISSSDVKFICKPHYTSKIKDDIDLLNLKTYGFRGEALFSLCTVADVSVTTKTKDDFVSKVYQYNHNGEIIDEKPSHHNIGTILTVKNLFKDLPVRKQIYRNCKKLKDELRKVEELLISYGLLIPKVRLTLKHNQSVIWRKNRTADHKYSISTLFGSNVLENLKHVNDNGKNVEIEAYFPIPNCNVDVVGRATSDRIFIFVNQRPVTVKEIKLLLKQMFVEYCCNGSNKYPTAAFFLKVKPDLVDVNLEPNKTTVLLQNLDEVLEKLKEMLNDLYGKCDETLRSPSTKSDKNHAGNVHSEVLVDHHVHQKEDKIEGKLPFLEYIDEVPQKTSSVAELPSVGGEPLQSKEVFHKSLVPSLEEAVVNVDQQREILDSELDDFNEEFVLDLPTPEKVDLKKWSKGETAHVTPVTLLRPLTVGDHQPDRKRKKDDNNASSLAKKMRKNNECPHQPRIDKMLQLKKRRRLSDNEIIVNFSWEEFCKKYKHRKTLTTSSKKMQFEIIGKIPSSSMWVVKCSDGLIVIDKARLSDKLLHNKLLSKHKFKADKLEVAVNLSKEVIGIERLASLCDMKTETPLNTLGRFISDSRITDNGFIIKRTEDSSAESPSFECTHVTNKIPCYGIDDLKKLLDNLHYSPFVRPTKVDLWCMEESKRLSQSNPCSCSYEEFHGILLETKKIYQEDFHKMLCCHGNPVSHKLNVRDIK